MPVDSGNVPSTRLTTVSDYWRSVACSRLNMRPDQVLWYFYEFPARGTSGIAVSAGGTSTANYQAGPPAALRISTAGTGANQYQAWSAAVDAGALRPLMFKAGTGAKWWVSSQFALPSTPRSTATVGVGMVDNSAIRMILGERGATSATNFVAYSDAGTPIDSGRAIDAASRVHAAWRDGSNGFYQIDSFAAVQGDIRPAADADIYLTVVDTAANAHNLDIVWWGAAMPLV
jgi:hypothetical protein